MTKSDEDGCVARLLIVEDERAQLRTLADIMTAEGFEVISCTTASEGLEHFARGKIDVAVVDLRLPDAKETELIGKFREIADDVPIIINTAYSSYESAKDAVNIGAFAYVEKAGDPSELVRHVRRAFQDRLRHYATGLENAVAQRTRELTEANAALRREIAERKRVAQALRESEVRYRTLFDRTAEGILVADVRTRKFLYANPAICNMLGYSEEELLSMEVADIRPEGSLTHVFAGVDAQDLGEWTLATESLCLRKDGTPIYADVNTAPAVIDGRACNIGFFTDVTERRRAEKALLDSEERYRQVVSSTTDAVMVFDAETRSFIEVNDACTLLYGYSKEEFVNMTHSEIAADEHASEESIRQTLAGQRHSILLRYHRKKDGTVFPVEISASTFIYRGRRVLCEIVRDITQRIHLEEQLRQAQKMEALGQLAGGVAHDFRNQLTVIRGFSEALLRRFLVTDEGRDRVTEILRAVDRSEMLTSQLLAFSRKETLEPRVVNLSDLVDDLGRSLPQIIGEDIMVSISRASEECLANLDPNLFDQAVMNLAINARDAMRDGGELIIETDVENVGAHFAEGRYNVKPGRYAVLSMEDTGIGMDDTTRSRAFEPFFTTKESSSGTGLGLSMVYGFVKQSGGFVECQSEVGKGTRISLYFPWTVSARKTGPAGETTHALRGSETILVVEDEEAVRRMLADSLQEAGYEVLEAATCTEAMRLSEKPPGPINLLISDVVMPGMNGPELAERIRAKRPGLRVLFISGYTGDELSRRNGDSAPGKLLAKPFTHDELLSSVRRVLDSTEGAVPAKR